MDDDEKINKTFTQANSRRINHVAGFNPASRGALSDDYFVRELCAG